jgi:hypothetical protein
MRLVKLILLTILGVLLFSYPGYSTSIEVTDEFDLQLAVDYAKQAGIDSLILTTSGGVYTHGISGAGTDTLHLAITFPLTIVAQEGLAERPIITNSDPNADLLDIIRIYDDFTVEGVIFDGGHEMSHGMKYALRSDNDETRGYFVDTDSDILVKNCIFRNFFEDKDPAKEGHVYKCAKVKIGTIRFEDCHFENTGYEAIRLSDTEKWDTDKTCDSLIVRNCTFENIAAECVRFYADLDTSTQDAYVLLENLTINNCGTEAIYIKNNQNALARNILITNTRPSYRPDRNDFLIELQQRGSWISNVDTFNCSSLTGLRRVEETEIYVSKYNARSVDLATIWGFDPLYADVANFDYTLMPGSHAYYSGHDGQALGDLNWATESPTVIPFTYASDGDGVLEFSPELEGQCFDANTEVTVTAVPDSGKEFVEWGGDLSGSDNPATIMVDASKHITATFQTSTAMDDEIAVVREFSLEQNYPNPFNPSTSIKYTVTKPGLVQLEIYDIRGSLVEILVNNKRQPGEYTAKWQPFHQSTGVYFYKLSAEDKTSIKKMMYIK